MRATTALIRIKAHLDGHECAKGAATLCHGFPDAAHQLLIMHSNPETGKGASHHAHGVTHYKAHLCVVEEARLGLSIGTYGHQHLAHSLSHSKNYS